MPNSDFPNDLDPCPFCGQAPPHLILKKIAVGLTDIYVFRVRCLGCLTEGPYGATTAIEAKRLWNERNINKLFERITRPIKLDLGENKTPEEIEEMFQGNGILTLGSVTAPKEVWRDIWASMKQEDKVTSESTDEEKNFSEETLVFINVLINVIEALLDNKDFLGLQLDRAVGVISDKQFEELASKHLVKPGITDEDALLDKVSFLLSHISKSFDAETIATMFLIKLEQAESYLLKLKSVNGEK